MSALLALLCLAAPGDERKPREVVCPVDGEKFAVVEVTATNQWGGVDADFCAHAIKTTPLESYVWACPACGFAGRKKDFETALPEGERLALKSGLKPRMELRRGMKQAEIPGHVKYDLLAQVARIRNQPRSDVGRAWLHASWSARQQGAVYLSDFDEWEALRTSYGLNQTPMQLGKKNRTDFELDVAGRLEKDLAAKRFAAGANRVLARYLAAYLFRKHGENAEAERWLAELEPLRDQNSVVAAAADRMKASIALEREFQAKAAEEYAAVLETPGLSAPAVAEFHYVCGELLRRLGRPAEATAQFQKALEVGPSDALRQLVERQRARLPR
jgi:tetratricopeptide (TPR) repeat protein